MYLHDEKISQFKNILKLVFKSFVQTGRHKWLKLVFLSGIYVRLDDPVIFNFIMDTIAGEISTERFWFKHFRYTINLSKRLNTFLIDINLCNLKQTFLSI